MVQSGKLPVSALEQVKVTAKDVTDPGEHMPNEIKLHILLLGNLTDIQQRQLLAAGISSPAVLSPCQSISSASALFVYDVSDLEIFVLIRRHVSMRVGCT